MKTSELTGVMLDYWVARAEGLECGVGPASNAPDKVCGVKLSTGWFFPWSPSTDWAIGGPIIERERIGLEDEGLHWSAGVESALTPLIAAMRAYVGSKFGDEVPDGPVIEGGPT